MPGGGAALMDLRGRFRKGRYAAGFLLVVQLIGVRWRELVRNVRAGPHVPYSPRAYEHLDNLTISVPGMGGNCGSLYPGPAGRRPEGEGKMTGAERPGPRVSRPSTGGVFPGCGWPRCA